MAFRLRPPMMRPLLLVLAAALCGCPATATSGPDLALPPQRCVPGEQRVCTCLGGGEAAQACQSDGRRFGACLGCPTGNDLGEVAPPLLPDGAVPGGSPCGECDGCCSGAACTASAAQGAASCGRKGEACHACGAGEVCVQGTCVVSTGSCSSASCASGCCSGTACVPANKQSWTLCGAPGGGCGACPYGVTCVGGCTDEIDPSATGFYIRVTYLGVKTESWDYLSGPDLLVCFGSGAQLGCARPCGDDSYGCSVSGDAGRIKDSVGATVAFSGEQLRKGIPIAVWDEDYPDGNDLIGNGPLPITKRQASYSTGPFVSVDQLSFEVY